VPDSEPTETTTAVVETPEGVGPPESIIVQSEDEADVLNPDGSVKEP
jgi:hypothetical protein